ncbi:MAG: AmmeMemoRadiSam system radical SAM enzyme [Actinobacteria bacterium]|nr:AmmeMemoRadiSam system radical SAM enzyme [Actinomycetota bacterium]
MKSQKKEPNYPGRYWHEIDEDMIQCDLCPRFCRLREGKRGFCFVRQNQNHQMILTTYGRSSGFCIDPIEKKPLNHFYPGTSVLSFGTAGCNLGCRFCQNWDISKAQEMDRLQDEASPEKIALTAKHLGCHSVAFTYNDPVIFTEYAIDIAKECQKQDIKTVAVTAGYITPEARKDFYSVIDGANIDLKAYCNTFYKTLCFANLEPVLETLRYLYHETQVWFEITTLLIPGENDSSTEIHMLSEWIKLNLGPEVPLHFTAFHPDFKMMDKEHTPAETLIQARDIALAAGLHYVYTGNIHHPSTGSTYCPNCQKCIIERDWHALGEYHINDQRCAFCEHPISGHFNPEPGTWGRRRLPVRLADM